jgi:hypothetical protein
VFATSGAVEVWSTVRLPFEPRGWLIDMRDELRRELLTLLSRGSSGRLHAVYCAADDGALVDTENVLLYNVGGTALRPLMANAVMFEHRYEVPPIPREAGLIDGQARHYHCYRHAPDASPEYWTPGRTLGAFSYVPTDRVDKPAPVWNAIRECAAPPPETASAPTRFIISAQITDTRPRPVDSVASIVKPALDGIISAYHSHQGSDGVEEARRLEAAGIGTAETLRNHLLNQRWAALGARRLVKPFGATGVQWNPADEFCVLAHISLVTGRPISDEHPARWRLTAELTEAIRTDAQPQPRRHRSAESGPFSRPGP